MAYMRRRRFVRKRRFRKRRTFKRRTYRRKTSKKRVPRMRTPRTQLRSTKYRTETIALPLEEYSAGEYTLNSESALAMPIVPKFNYLSIAFTKDSINKQLNGAIGDQYGTFKVIKAKVNWRLDVPNTSNYFLNETKTGSFLDEYLNPIANQVQIDEVLQAPFGRFHGAKYGSRTYWPKYFKRETLEYIDSGSAADFTSVVPENRWLRSTVNGNCQWRGLSLLLPGVGSIAQPDPNETDSKINKQYIPKWQIRTYVTIKFSHYKDYDIDP